MDHMADLSSGEKGAKKMSKQSLSNQFQNEITGYNATQPSMKNAKSFKTHKKKHGEPTFPCE